jgi:uncharacterized protein (DUF1499 family)
MRLAGLLIGLLMPACGFEGAQGLPPPALMDMSALHRPATPNTALAAARGFSPTPDIITRQYDVPPARLYAALKEVAAAQPRTFPAGEFPAQMQVHYVARSAFFNFPDLVTAQVNPDSALTLWSRSVYGRSDLGVNRKRLEQWLAALDRDLGR